MLSTGRVCFRAVKQKGWKLGTRLRAEKKKKEYGNEMNSYSDGHNKSSSDCCSVFIESNK